MDDKETADKLHEILKSKNLTKFERVQIEEVLESVEDRINNPTIADDLPDDKRKQHYSNVYRRKIPGRD